MYGYSLNMFFFNLHKRKFILLYRKFVIQKKNSYFKMSFDNERNCIVCGIKESSYRKHLKRFLEITTEEESNIFNCEYGDIICQKHNRLSRNDRIQGSSSFNVKKNINAINQRSQLFSNLSHAFQKITHIKTIIS